MLHNRMCHSAIRRRTNLQTMTLSSWISRLRSSSRPFYTKFRNYRSHEHDAAVPRSPAAAERFRGPSFSHWESSLLPLAFTVSAASLALHSYFNNAPSCCEADKRIGGTDSTNYVVKGSHREVPQELIEELSIICKENMTMDYDERYYHGKPQNSFHKAQNIPDVIVFPRFAPLFRDSSVFYGLFFTTLCLIAGLEETVCTWTEEEVSKIVVSCNKHKVPIVPYGGATSIEGHTLSPSGGVCIDMTQMKRIKSLNVKDMDVVVEPGIGWMDLNEYLEPYGLFFPLDPGPGATIGGMCATRCSGSLAVRYGTMRENVINLKAVLANGDIVKTGSRARKSAAGYDLTRLMIGSEGTLGVITEVTLRLQKIPQFSVVFS
ncbi:hypothetical protein SASPL_102092 [Salvia splendens]|uniref:FAD-binding PCMH-type domain-containing protein n=1 Tax=Salvia splendens TaxID=180675 RepID=A0A8X8YR80_SALSN|nr:hypothetical protein SASPL_102092 [Salvia splendens]